MKSFRYRACLIALIMAFCLMGCSSQKPAPPTENDREGEIEAAGSNEYSAGNHLPGVGESDLIQYEADGNSSREYIKETMNKELENKGLQLSPDVRNMLDEKLTPLAEHLDLHPQDKPAVENKIIEIAEGLKDVKDHNKSNRPLDEPSLTRVIDAVCCGCDLCCESCSQGKCK